MAYNKVVYGSQVLIDLTGDTATADKILQGYTAHDKSGESVTGTCPFDVDSSDATAAVSELLEGKTAYARGSKITGTMPNKGAVQGEIAAKAESYAKIKQTEQEKLIPGNIKSGIEILGVTGSYGGESVTAQAKTATPSTAEQTILPDENYDYLSSVTILAIPYTETPNAAGGTTVTIGA